MNSGQSWLRISIMAVSNPSCFILIWQRSPASLKRLLKSFLAVSESRFGPMTATTKFVFFCTFFTEITSG